MIRDQRSISDRGSDWIADLRECYSLEYRGNEERMFLWLFESWRKGENVWRTWWAMKGNKRSSLPSDQSILLTSKDHRLRVEFSSDSSVERSVPFPHSVIFLSNRLVTFPFPVLASLSRISLILMNALRIMEDVNMSARIELVSCLSTATVHLIWSSRQIWIRFRWSRMFMSLWIRSLIRWNELQGRRMLLSD